MGKGPFWPILAQGSVWHVADVLVCLTRMASRPQPHVCFHKCAARPSAFYGGFLWEAFYGILGFSELSPAPFTNLLLLHFCQIKTLVGTHPNHALPARPPATSCTRQPPPAEADLHDRTAPLLVITVEWVKPAATATATGRAT